MDTWVFPPLSNVIARSLNGDSQPELMVDVQGRYGYLTLNRPGA